MLSKKVVVTVDVHQNKWCRNNWLPNLVVVEVIGVEVSGCRSKLHVPLFVNLKF